MAKNLLIVESPAKAKTITKILGKDFKVMASVGHIRDLASKGRGKTTFGIDIENGFEPQYAILKGKTATVEKLKEATKKVENVYLAPDPDREGEAIAWHLKEVLELSDEKAMRVTYQAVTKKAVTEAIANPHKINMNLVNAQQARRILDRLVGFRLSPFLWKKVAKNLSAGRVQSVALEIIVDREREIEAFISEEYWKVVVTLLSEGTEIPFKADLVRWKGEKFALGNPVCEGEERVQEIVEKLRKTTFTVESLKSKRSESRAPAPFITSTLQQGASTKLGYNPSRTMRIAQQLYEGVELGSGPEGLITYMRTDSVRLSPEGLSDAREYIAKTFDAEYLPEKANFFSNKKSGSQDAHEAIRPYNANYTPEYLKAHLTPDQLKLYRLIWQRFIASQMKPAVFNTTTLSVMGDEGLFEASGRQLLFDGHLAVSGRDKKESDKYQDLPGVKEGESLELKELDSQQHFTKPPNRYSEAGLVRALEKEGVGRPSTYAPIIQTLKERGYAVLKEKAFHTTELGKVVCDILRENFLQIMNLKFTAEMEEQLDEVEEGKNDWKTLLSDFYTPFDKEVATAIEEVEPLKGRPYKGEEKCPICEGELLIRYSTRGAFLGCANYPECKGILSMPGEGEEELPAEKMDCPSCGKQMIAKTSRYGDRFLACTGYPECKTTRQIDAEGKIVELPEIDRDCDLCGKPMVIKRSRRGMFLGCSGYPECKNTLALSKEGKVIEVPKLKEKIDCEKCGSEMAVKMGPRGPFLACTAYPKCRNSKPLPKEVQSNEK